MQHKAAYLSALLVVERTTAGRPDYAHPPRGQADGPCGPQEPIITQGRERPQQVVEEVGRHNAHTEF